MSLPAIKPFKQRFAQLEEQMQAPDFYADARRAADVGREHQQLRLLIEAHDSYTAMESDAAEHTTMLRDSSADADLKELAQEELTEIEARLPQLEQDILVMMLPPDPSDSRASVVEIRAGAGGDEASLFAGDLYRMYTRLCEARGWKIEPMGGSTNECGGFKEISFLVKGEDVYKHLKFESGVHRVQRVPVTESGGRIHTSTATVAVLPEAQEVDIHIDPSDLDISVCRASGPGGQGVNTTDSAVQIIHKPTNIMVVCADERSQIKNKSKAMTVLRSRLLQQKQEEEAAKYAAQRKDQVGTADRSERIRTYNFPQSRLTDHRIGYSSHNLPGIMEGDLTDLIVALQKADHEARVQAMLDSTQAQADAA